jgi:hypothetical protein
MPPDFGIMAPNSEKINAPNKEKTPAMIHAAVSHNGDCTCIAMVAGFMKTPEPIILPMIIDVAAQKLMVRGIDVLESGILSTS